MKHVSHRVISSIHTPDPRGLTFSIRRHDDKIQQPDPPIVVASDPAHEIVHLHPEPNVPGAGITYIDLATLPADDHLLRLASQNVVRGHRCGAGLRLDAPHSHVLLEHTDRAVLDAVHKLAGAQGDQILYLVALGKLMQQRFLLVDPYASIIRAGDEL